MSELVAVQGTTIEPEPTPAVTATIVVNPPDAPVLHLAKPAHKDGDQITVTAITTPAAPVPDPGPYVVAMVAESVVLTGSKPLLREGDASEEITATPTTSGGTPTPVTFKCVVTSAGQTKVYAK